MRFMPAAVAVVAVIVESSRTSAVVLEVVHSFSPIGPWPSLISDFLFSEQKMEVKVAF